MENRPLGAILALTAPFIAGLASAMKTVPTLLQLNYSKYQTQSEVDDYIRQLRTALRDATLKNNFLTETEQKMYIKELSDVSIYPFDNQIMAPEDMMAQTGTAFEITATIDPKRFPQLIITPIYEQIKYFKRIFSKLIIDNELSNIYGSFETQKNGNIHFHAITYIYNNTDNSNRLEELISSYLTNAKYNRTSKFKNTQCKPIRTTIEQWFTYINKSPLDHIEWNLRKKGLDL